MQKYFFIIFFLCSYQKKLFSQESKTSPLKVVLTVLEKGSGTPLKKVEIKVNEDIYFTNGKGKVEFLINSNDNKIDIYKSSYKKEVLSTEKFNKETNEETIYLFPDQPEDNLVVIFGKKKTEVSKKEISIEEAESVAPRGDPAQITKLLPGVQTRPFNPQIVVRGSAPDDSRYFVDNFDFPFIYHSVGGISVLPKQILSDVVFYAGGFGPKYGEATGGIIKLETKNEVAEKKQSDIIVNLPLYSSFFHNQPISKTQSLSLSTRISYVDLLTKKFVPKEQVVLPSFKDAHLQWLNKTSDGFQKLLLVGSADSLKISTPSDNAVTEDGQIKFEFSTKFALLGFERSGKISKNLKYKTSPQIRHTIVKNEFLDNYVKIKGNTYRIPSFLSYKISKNENFNLGLDLDCSVVNVSVLAPRFVQDDPFFDFEEATLVESTSRFAEGAVSLWSTVDIKLGDFLFTPGLRSSYVTQITDKSFDPRLTLSWQYNKTDQLKLALGQYSKTPQPRETDKIFGNPDLTFEKSLHYILAWEQNWGDKWSLDLQVYYKKNRDVIRSDPIKRFNNSGELQSKGIEIFLRRNKTERAFAWISYTLSKNEERPNTSSPWQAARFDQTHVLNLVGNYQVGGQWSLGTRIFYHTGDRFNPVNNSVYHANFAKYQRRYKESERYKARLPDYYQMNIYGVYDFLFNNWKLKLRGGIEYLSFTRPPLGVDYNYDYTEKKYIKGLPPIPYIEIQGIL